MTTVTKTVRFDAAHILSDDRGLCRNLHGHTYRVEVSVSCPDGASGDMVMDFRELKAVLAEVICGRFDHAFIYSTASDGERDVAAAVARQGMRLAPLPFRSTVENLARHFHGILKARLPGLAAVKVWETPDNCAAYREDGGDGNG